MIRFGCGRELKQRIAPQHRLDPVPPLLDQGVGGGLRVALHRARRPAGACSAVVERQTQQIAVQPLEIRSV